MDRDVKKINDIMVNIFNLVNKSEEDFIRESSAHDLSVTEVHTLDAIGTGRPRTMTHVASILEINVSTLTSAINKLVKKGYVERLRDDNDRRMVKIHLTDRGISAVEEHQKFHETMIKAAIKKMPVDDLPQFISLIDNINQFLIEARSMVYAKTTPFELRPLQLGQQLLPVPIANAGMSIGVAGERLAAAVASQGGLGLIGTSEIGYEDENYDDDRLAANVEAIENKVRAARKRVRENGGKGLIGVNIMWNMENSYRYVEAAVRSGAQVIVTSAGIPKDLPRYCSDKKVALLPTISSKRAAAAIIKTWGQRYNRLPDGFIFQGPTAAGILGFKEAELERAGQEKFKLIAEIKAEISKLENCPLIVGGGIINRDDAETVYKYGADGFMMGTRFVVTDECDIDDEYKKLYLNCGSNDVTIIRSPMKTSVRVMKNRFSDLISACDDDYDIIEAVKRGVRGDYEGGLIFCTEDADRIERIDSVADVFREFTS